MRLLQIDCANSQRLDIRCGSLVDNKESNYKVRFENNRGHNIVQYMAAAFEIQSEKPESN